MADAVRLIWLESGALPIFPFTGTLHYLAGGEDDKENPALHWWPASFRGPNAIIPIIATTLEEFLAFMEESNVVEGNTLYVAVRTFARLETSGPVGFDDRDRTFINSLMLAVAIVPGDVEGAVPHRWRFEPLSTLSQLCTINERVEEPENPILKAAWLQLAEGREQHRQYRAVQDRAQRLLESHLDEEQLTEFKKRHRFRVAGGDGLVYLITYESHGNVWQIESGVDGKIIPRTNYCIVPTESVPIYDQMLAQKLFIEHDLPAFKATANLTHFDDEGNRIP